MSAVACARNNVHPPQLRCRGTGLYVITHDNGEQGVSACISFSLQRLWSVTYQRWSLTYSKEDVEDLFQETFLRALEQPEKIEASENPKGFLFSTALYLWKSWKRKYARRKRIAPSESLNEATENGINLEDSYLKNEENMTVRKLVDNLPDKYKIPTILYYTSEMSIPNIAETRPPSV